MAYRFGQAALKWPEDLISPVMSVRLPRGQTDIRIRIASYANRSRALEIQDASGRPFYWATLPVEPADMAGLLPVEEQEQLIVAIKPSAIAGGMANALIDAGILTDYNCEMAVDHHWVRLMRVERAIWDALPKEAEPPALLPMQLVEDPDADEHSQWGFRVQQAFASAGLGISLDAGCEAMARYRGKYRPRLPESAEDIVRLLSPFFRAEGEGRKVK